MIQCENECQTRDGSQLAQTRDEIWMKPEEYDVVRLLRPLVEYDLPAGARGAVVFDHTKDSAPGAPPAYEVEFTDGHGVTWAVVTVEEKDLEVISRSHC